jgi:hypothetical protein
MSKEKYLMIWLVMLFISASCSENDNPAPVKPKVEIPNDKPNPFNVQVSNVTHHSAVVTWGPVHDDEQDALSHTIILNGQIIAKDLQRDEQFKLANLTPSTEYSGEVRVSDFVNESVSVPFSFATHRYLNTFNMLNEGYNGVVPSGMALAKTADGGYFIFGRVSANNSVYFAKTDSLGYEQWHTHVLEVEYYQSDHELLETKQGGFIAINGKQIFHLDQNGQIIWSTTKSLSIHRGIAETADNQFLVIDQDGTLHKFSALGELIWSKQYADIITSGYDITMGDDGDFGVLGRYDKDFPLGDYISEVAVVKINEDGELIWSDRYPHEHFNGPVKIVRTGDNGFVFASASLTHTAKFLVRVVKISSEGIVQWDKEFSWAVYDTICNALIQTSDGGYAIAGSSSSDSVDAMLAKFDEDGNLLWQKNFKPEYYDYRWEFYDLKEAADKGLIMVGRKSWIHIYNGQEEGLWLLKTDHDGIISD